MGETRTAALVLAGAVVKGAFEADARDGLERVFVAATASAAFPVLFAPVDVPGVGPCTDGGLVNNTPILAAFGPDADERLDAILVITPTPTLFRPPPQTYRGLRLL